MKKWLYVCCFFALLACDVDSYVDSVSYEGTGKGGSLTRFTIINNQLFVLDESSVRLYNIADDGSFNLHQELNVGSNLETISYNGEYIFIGSSSAVHFLELGPGDQINFLSSYRHITACDPVVGIEGIAYSTLRSSGCRFNNEEVLDVIDYSDVFNPILIRSYSTFSPLGLAVNNDFLFVCENNGMTVYDRSNPRQLEKLDFMNIPNDVPIDLIVNGSQIIIRSEQGMYNASVNESGELAYLGSLVE